MLLILNNLQHQFDYHGADKADDDSDDDNTWLHSSSAGAAYMRKWTGSVLLQIMGCRLFGAKPLPELMLAYGQLDP